MTAVEPVQLHRRTVEERLDQPQRSFGLPLLEQAESETAQRPLRQQLQASGVRDLA